MTEKPGECDPCDVQLDGLIDCEPFECLIFPPEQGWRLRQGDFTDNGSECDIEVCYPATRISGYDCELNPISNPADGCTGVECLAFNTGDFAVDIDGDCRGLVCLRTGNALGISGYKAIDDCCAAGGPLTEFPNVGNIQFGSGFRIEEVTAGEDGECCIPGDKGGLKIDVCTPKVSGWKDTTAGGQPLDCCEEPEVRLDCTGYDCLVFDEPFKINYNAEECTAEIKVCMPKISGAYPYVGDCDPCDEIGGTIDCEPFECLIFPPEQGWQIRQGDFTNNGNDCDIEVCYPATRISGYDCDLNPISNPADGCTGVECLAFNTGDFAVDIDENCRGLVCLRTGNALGISGYGASDGCLYFRVIES